MSNNRNQSRILNNANTACIICGKEFLKMNAISMFCKFEATSRVGKIDPFDGLNFELHFSGR